MVHQNDNSTDSRPASATIESKSEAIPKGGPSALVRGTPENTLATKANDEVSTSGGALDEISTSGMDKVIERPPITEVPARSLDNSRFHVSEDRPAHLTGDLSLNDDRSVSVLVRDTAEETSGTGVKDEILRQTDRGTSSTDNVREDMVVERPQVTEKPLRSSGNPRVDFLEERPIADISGELLSTSDGGAASATIEPKSEVIPNGEAPALIRETPEDTLATSARDGVLGQTDRGINEPSTSSMDKVVERPQVTKIWTPCLDNRGVDVSEERCIAHTTGELSSSDNNSCPPTMESTSDTFPERGPPAMVGDSVVTRAEDTLATSTRDEVLGHTNGRIEETYASIMDKVVVRPPATEMPALSLDNPGMDVSEERHIPHTTGDLSSTDNNSFSTTMESTSDIISEREPPAMVGDPVVTRPEGILATSARDEVLGQTDVGIEDTSTSSVDKVVERPQATEMPTLSSDNPGVDVSEERHIPHTTESCTIPL
ncbi:hypothetical protein L7F22_055891 [Adiantum nelumboides]|nr:hypothetical protein [Adiantum nelumboides]